MATTSHTTTTLLSFYQWFDNWVLQRGQAYFNTSSRFYYQPDPSLASKVAYASPFRCFVWDSGVSGAHIISSISGSLGVLGPGQSGMQIDYMNGRVLLDPAVGTSAIISGSYAVKDVNLYFANQSQERIVMTNKYALNSRFGRPSTGIAPPNAFVTPCAFISSPSEVNTPNSFGGLYDTKTAITINVLAETQAQLEGILSLAVDADQLSFPQIPASVYPLGVSGELKTGYNYVATQNQYCSPGNLYTITEVRGSKMPDVVKADESLWIGIVELEVVRTRTIH